MTLSRVPTTGMFDKCTSNCALYKAQVNNCHAVSMTGLFGKRFYSCTLVIGNRIPTTCTLAGLYSYDSPYTKSLVCLSSVKKSWEHNGKVELLSTNAFTIPLTCVTFVDGRRQTDERPVFVQVNRSHTAESIH